MSLVTNKLLFIHCPKTGGTFVRSALARALTSNTEESGPFEIEDHYSIAETLSAHPELSSKLSFGFVRDPYTWIQSRWAWAVKTQFPAKIRPDSDLYERPAANHWMAPVWSDCFYEFVRNILEKHPRAPSDTFNDKLSLGSELEVNFVGKYEKLHDDLLAVLEKSGEEYDPTKLSDVARTKVGASDPDWADRLKIWDLGIIQKIYDANSEICERFHYG